MENGRDYDYVFFSSVTLTLKDKTSNHHQSRPLPLEDPKMAAVHVLRPTRPARAARRGRALRALSAGPCRPGGPPCSWQPACAFLDGDPAAWKRAASENRPCPSRPRSKAQGRRQSSGSGRDVTRNVLEAGWCRPQAAAGEPGRGAACKLRTGFPWEDWSGDEKRTESRIWLHTVSFSVEDGSVVLEFVRKAVELVCVTSCR